MLASQPAAGETRRGRRGSRRTASPPGPHDAPARRRRAPGAAAGAGVPGGAANQTLAPGGSPVAVLPLFGEAATHVALGASCINRVITVRLPSGRRCSRRGQILGFCTQCKSPCLEASTRAGCSPDNKSSPSRGGRFRRAAGNRLAVPPHLPATVAAGRRLKHRTAKNLPLRLSLACWKWWEAYSQSACQESGILGV